MPGLGPPAGSTDGSAPPVPESWQRQANADQIGDYARTPTPSPASSQQSSGGGDAGSGGQGPSQGTDGAGGGDGGTSAPSDYTLAQFHVDLQALSDATREVRYASTEIAGYMRSVGTLASQLQDHWQGPAHSSFDAVQMWFQRTERELHDLLDDIVRRMKVSYDNFHQAELVNLANMETRTQDLAHVPQPAQPGHVRVVEHAGAGGAVSSKARTELAAEHVQGEGLRYLLPAEGETGAFRPETAPVEEFGGDGGGVPSEPRTELAVQYVSADGSPVDGGVGQGGGGPVPSEPRTELAVQYVSADGSPVDGGAGQGGGGPVPSQPRTELAVVHEPAADGTQDGDGGQGR
ncbi:WXG100 family type VII secretion target [Streptomyces sp. NPDC053499]|uniref:WXG100 family type VII secretion target n=1 Tax=Streptomyces sp. NPDC053499 TaxID=3365707 RepID=UPI0037D0F48F